APSNAVQAVVCTLPALLPLFIHSVIHAFTPTDVFWLCAAALAALLRCAPAAPVDGAFTDNPAGDTSGEEWETERPADPLIALLKVVLEVIKTHRQEFEAEFHIRYDVLAQYNIPSLPADCPSTNFSMEALLHRLLQGLPVYTALLKYVEKEEPKSQIPSRFRQNSELLKQRITGKMRHAVQVTPLTSSQEQQLLRDLDSSDTFHRKMTAHSILYQLRSFLVDCKNAINKKEKLRESRANRAMTPVTLYYQS
uniref:Interleukin-6 n=1 Tax=Sparus aurata TaxID=8175 RepID=A0A671WFF8_SPAAU